MNNSIDTLLSKGGEPLMPKPSPAESLGKYLGRWGAIGMDLATLLSQRNGFYAFEDALLVRPLDSSSQPLGLMQWNEPELWKKEYEQIFDNVLFFAEDVFGGQFCIRETAIYVFDPETGEYESIGDSLESWIAEILKDPDFRTGFPLLEEWKESRGSLQRGQRLVPKVPFFTGGKFEVENLSARADVTGMQFRGSIARQARKVPYGDKLIFRRGSEPPPPDSN